jgi:hypothetical protein
VKPPTHPRTTPLPEQLPKTTDIFPEKREIGCSRLPFLIRRDGLNHQNITIVYFITNRPGLRLRDD